jgi:anaphase-promoting complex subunit 3
MQQDAHPSFLPHLCQRFQHLVWSCLDSDLTKTAVFHAERYFAMDQRNHDARHLYAMALFRESQTYSALCLVNVAPDVQCIGCLEIKAKCCSTLGRHQQAREALEEVMKRKDYVPSGALLYFGCYIQLTSICVGSLGQRSANPFPDEAALQCRSGTMALKGNVPEQAMLNFRQALALNPYLWEAFEGLCATGKSKIFFSFLF